MEEKISQISDLISLMLCDGKVKEKEYDFVIRIADEMGISQLEVDMMFDKKNEFKPPKSEFDRIIQFYRLMIVMHADKVVDGKELNLLKNLAIKMGLNPITTDKLIELSHQYEDNRIPSDVFVKVFKANHN